MGWAGSRKKKLDCHSPKLARGGAFCPPRLHTHPTTTCRVLPPSLFFHSQLRTWAFGNNHILLFSSTPPPPLLSFPFFPHRALLNHATPKKKKRGESKTKRRLHSFTPSPRVPSPLPPPQSAFARVRVLLPNPPRTDEHHELIGSVVLVCSRLHCVVAFFVFFFDLIWGWGFWVW